MAFAFSILLYLQSYRLALRLAFPNEGGLEAYRVPYKQQQWVRFSLYTGNFTGYAVLLLKEPTKLLAILAQAYQCFLPVSSNDASIKSSHSLTIPPILAPTRLALAGIISSHDSIMLIARVHCLDSFTPGRCQPRMYR